MVVLAAVAAAGAVLSFSSLYTAAAPVFGPVLAAGFPLLVDALCLGASLAYAAGATVGRPRAGWRLTAHAAAAGTIALNALAAHRLADVPWHVTAPATWSVLVELTARELLGTWRATHTAPRDQIPARLWLTAPIESTRTWLLMARTGTVTHAGARIDVGVHAAAVQALHLALPGRRARRVRAVLRRQLRAGSLPPSAVLHALGWTSPDGGAAVSSTSAPAAVSPTTALRTALAGVLADRTRPRPADAVHSDDPGDAPHSPASTQRPPAPSPDPAESRSEYTPSPSSSTPAARAAAARGDGGRRP
ncbi:DUF2637 domain-containing protein, partial [Kineosporia sp. A_224]|uniref:DUF2637 domain-containing protein n=1 Tax=Kineosporia sp. A_224 TaxID=1962180 RepID=UPI00350EF9AD